MRFLSMFLLVAGVAAGQSAPPPKDIPAIAQAANGVVVSIITSDKGGHPVAQGTGFLVSRDGRIVTNYHVIKGASSAIIKLPDGAYYDVDGVVAFDEARDLAVIKAHGQNFRVATLGNSDRVKVGEEIVAIGSPLSLESTVSSGIVSGIRTIEGAGPAAQCSGIQLPPGYEDAKPVKGDPCAQAEGRKLLQITAPISPGSSGGPLFNMAGEVVGITSLFLKGGENLNFAIPINDAKLLLSSDSEVQDLSALTSDPLANLGTPATPNTAPSLSVPASPPIASPSVQPRVEHATTAEQCVADARVWGSRTASFVKQLRYTDLQTGASEMTDCYVPGVGDEPTVRKNLRYLSVFSVYESEMIIRMVMYIARHDAWSQYMSEHVPFLSITQNPPEHAPTLKQCNADALLWTQQNQGGMSDALSANELYARPIEMSKCTTEITGTDFLAVATTGTYLSVNSFYNAKMLEEIHAYLLRHNEWSQFVSEDAAGVR